MNAFAHSSDRRRPGSFVPRLEALEDRCLLACSVTTEVISSTYHILHIVGDGGNNSVVILDNDTSKGGSVTVICNGVPTTPAVAVNRIDVHALGGNNTVLYRLPGGDPLSMPGRQIDVDLGGSNNYFSALLGGSLAGGTSLNVHGGDGNDTLNIDMLPTVIGDRGPFLGGVTLNLVGGAGNDLLRVNAPNVLFPLAGGLISGPRPLTVNLIGGSGSDLILADIGARLDQGSDLGVLAKGGLGNNLMNVNLRLNRDAPFGPDPLGGDAAVHAYVQGGPGNDNLGLFVNPRSIRRNSIDAAMGGGGGFDIFRHTRNVRVIGHKR
jgi:hypothetical protein